MGYVLRADEAIKVNSNRLVIIFLPSVRPTMWAEMTGATSGGWMWDSAQWSVRVFLRHLSRE